MKYELGNLMAEEPKNEALVLLGFRLNKMRQEMDALLNERDDLYGRFKAAGLELKQLYRQVEDLTNERDEARELADKWLGIACEQSRHRPLLPWQLPVSTI